MDNLTALKDLQQNLELIGQPRERFTKIANDLCTAIKECLKVFPEKNVYRRLVHVYPCEVIAVQLFLTQVGFHLHSIHDGISSDGTIPYVVFPNWK